MALKNQVLLLILMPIFAFCQKNIPSKTSKGKESVSPFKGGIYRVYDAVTDSQISYAGLFDMFAYVDSSCIIVGYELDENSFVEETQKFSNNHQIKKIVRSKSMVGFPAKIVRDSIMAIGDDKSNKFKIFSDSTLADEKIVLKKIRTLKLY